jgi:hypothetical protein
LSLLGARSGLAVRRRGAKLYKDKETSADMSETKRIFVGWVDFRPDDWAAHGYSDKAEWAGAVVELNSEFRRLLQTKYLEGRAVTVAGSLQDEHAGDSEIQVKFSRVRIDYSRYHLHLGIHFVDPKSGGEIGSIPVRPYFGNDWGLVNYLKAALDEAAQKIDVEITGRPPATNRK